MKHTQHTYWRGNTRVWESGSWDCDVEDYGTLSGRDDIFSRIFYKKYAVLETTTKWSRQQENQEFACSYYKSNLYFFLCNMHSQIHKIFNSQFSAVSEVHLVTFCVRCRTIYGSWAQPRAVFSGLKPPNSQTPFTLSGEGAQDSTLA